ncbi:amino acid adenylation domain-containing protein [Trinickia sp. LjRoot230]|uniref:amino acid adenylation domain-containing protein n=1 Tax=Trinickia sp. LjRoot230 TaxID=3342288 RepID=UPI003ED039FE
MTSFQSALHHRIRALARLSPQVPAFAMPMPTTPMSLTMHGEAHVTLTRGELDARAAQLAAQLREAGVGTEVRVGVCVERSCELFVALLAVLKAGGVFVPLDPRHPSARLDWIARDAGLVHGIVDRHADEATRARFEQCFTVSQDDAAPAFNPRACHDGVEVHPRAAAYMIYTSGSTGTPKAVVVEHGALAAHCEALAAMLPVTSTDRLLHFASINFDAAHECWLAPLSVGTSVVIAPPAPFPPDAAHALIVRTQATIAAFPPAYLREFAAVAQRAGVPPSLRVLAFGGEALSQAAFVDVQRVFGAVRLVNGYGPTEAVMSPMLWPVEPGAAAHVPTNDPYASLPIGWPIGPRVARIDGAVKPGEAGELLLGGLCLARGYDGRPALTAERFVPDPQGAPGTRVYRTGDIARERADAAFDYLGRIDDQVQVRGVRVEPGEVAACLRAHPSVRDAAVHADVAGDRTRLIACVAMEDSLFDDASLKAWLAARLPDAWLPHRYLRFEQLPYSLNGKLDRDALRQRVTALPVAAAREDYLAPETDTECRLAQLWQRILRETVPVGLNDRLFSLGVDSLAAMQLQAAIRIEWRVNLRLDALFNDPSLRALAALIDGSEIENDAHAMMSIHASSPSSSSLASSPDAPFVDRAASFAQQRFWALARTRDAGDAYHIAAHWELCGPLDAVALQRALDCVIARHEAWRTTLIERDDGIVMQRIHAELPVPVQRVQLDENASEQAQEAHAAALAEAHAAEPFDLSQGPLVRATLVAFAANRHRLMLCAHHAVTDGWSSRIVFEELAAAYAALVDGSDATRSPLPIQYADYAEWQRAFVAGEQGQRQRAYWRAKLAGAPGPLALAYDRSPEPARDWRGERTTLRLSVQTSAAVRALARRTQASTFTVLLAAFDAWLYRLTGQTDIVVATPIADRRRPETAPIIGLFLNTLALRARVEPLAPFSTLLDAVRATALEAYAHEDLPFDQVLDAAKPQVPHGAPWLRVKFAQQFEARLVSALPGGLTAVALPGPDFAARFDFALDFTDGEIGEVGESIELVAAYARDCIDTATANAWLASFASLVADGVRDPQQPVTALDCADSAAHRAAREGRRLPLAHADVLAAFATHASATPHRVALVDADAETTLTFAALDDASDRVALALRQRGAAAECPVAVCIERSAAFVVALLGVLKSGAYAVPLDPSAPAERLAAAVDACGAEWILVAGEAPATTSMRAQTLSIDAIANDAALASTEFRRARLTPEQAAYLIYTSGSTGVPKGVVVSHRALADYVEGMLDELAFLPDASMAMVSTVAADLGHTTLFGALCSGRTLHLLPASCAFDPDRFAHEMRTRAVGILKIVPSHLHALLEAQHAADVLPEHALVMGGEVLQSTLVERVTALKSGCRVINHYGPTEATVGALTCDASAFGLMRTGDSVPLGMPLPNAYACVLDAYGALVPPGATGELYLGGTGVARGYLGLAAATAVRFVPHPDAYGERLYRTGDRVRLLADRRIAFLGRFDDQVKIRGYRVEPGEVSAALRAIDGVAQAETLAFEHEGRLRLAAFVSAHRDARIEHAALRDALSLRLPEHMVPATVTVLAALPVTANGKVDRAALRAHAATAATTEAAAAGSVSHTTAADAPLGSVEVALAAVWADVLKTPHVGRDDNFFELGGDSILILQVIARSRKRGISLTPKQLFDAPTVAQLARLATVTMTMTQGPASNVAPAIAAGVKASALTPAQHRFFALDIAQRGHWNQSVTFDTRAPLDIEAFARAFEALLTHHDAFRQRFVQRGERGPWTLVYAPRAFETLPLALTTARDEADAIAQFDALQCTLDLALGPLACALVATLPDGCTRLYLAIHHLIVDGVSWRILLDDLDAGYRAACERRSIRLGPTGVRADQWAARLSLAASDAASPLPVEAAYWAKQEAPNADVRLDHPDARATNADAAVVDQTLDAALTRTVLTDANVAYRTQAIDLLIAALAAALSERSGNHDAAEPERGVYPIELEGHGREALFDDIDASHTIGWLTSHYPVVLPIERALADTLAAVKDALRAVPNKGLGFGVLLHAGEPAIRTKLAALTRPHVTFNYLGQLDTPRDGVLLPHFGGAGCERDPRGPLANALAIHAWLDGDGHGDGARTLKLRWVYGTTQFERATIDALSARFEAVLREMTAACVARVGQRGGGSGATPADYPLARSAGLTQDVLDRTALDWRTIDDVYPLAPMQQGILFHSLMAPERATYVSQLVATLVAPDIERLCAAFEAAVARHDILRTSFLSDEAAPMQIVHRRAQLPVIVLDWRHDIGQTPPSLDTWLADDRARGFDLQMPPLMRLSLIRLSDDEWRLVWTRHHLLLDGWSTARLLAEVLREYREPPSRLRAFAAPVKTRYRDFIAWLGTRDVESDRAYWQRRLAHLDEPTLVAERDAAFAGHAHARQRVWRASLDAALTARMTMTARHLKITMNTLVQGAWALALQRITHRSSVAFGATVAGRPHALADIDTVLGLFINTLPVITAPLPQRRAAQWLRELQSESAAAAEHAHTPLYEIQRWARQSGGALFDTLIVFENYPVDETGSSDASEALKIRDLRSIEATDFALTLVIESATGMTIDYGYDAARIDESRVVALHRAFAACLDALASDSDVRLGAISIAAPEDIAMAARCNASARSWDDVARMPLHRQFERAARATPDAIALEFADAQGVMRQMRYGELDNCAMRLAASLVAAGVTPDTPVALFVERSFDMVIAILGVLKAGAAWLPVDPDYPDERVAYMLADAKPAVVLTQAPLRARAESACASCENVRIITVADLMASVVTHDVDIDIPIHDEQLAYLIYTSGSTGKPKGAGNTHGALANRIAWMQDAYRLTRDDVVLHKTPFSFDVSVWEFMWPLSVGAKLAIAAPGEHRDPARLVAAIEAHGVTTLHFVPSMLAAFLAYLADAGDEPRCASVEQIVASGEALTPDLVARTARQLPHAQLHNLYGPTEAAIDVSHWHCTPGDSMGTSVPIGRAIANVQLHVLDTAWQPVPVGAIGELYLGGAGLARGYLGRFAMTADRFVPDPFGAPGARLYRTGDLARRRPDGALDYLGRVDTQVKLRGQRIELGEIETLLRGAPGVRDAVVAVRNEQLIGYVVRGAQPLPNETTLIETLRAQLPAYMVPARLIELEALPLTPNGKCDRHALPAPAAKTSSETAPSTATERELAAIWQQVLKVDAFGRDDDFFALGGHSLLATQANAQTNLHWAISLPLRTLFDERTLARCAAAIDLALAARGDAADAASAIDALLGELETQ